MMKKLPNTPESEAAYLGAVLVDNQVLVDYPVVAQDFYTVSYRLVYEAMAAMFKAHMPIDIVTLYKYMEDAGTVKAAGGLNAITGLGRPIPSGKLAQQYAKDIIADSQRRQVVKALEGALDEVESADISAVVESAVRDLTKAVAGNASEKDSAGRVYDFLDYLEERARLGEMPGISSGIIALDRITHGWQQGDLIILAARPAMGKTALALNFAHAAAKNGVKTTVISLEMPYEQIMARIFARYEGLTMNDVAVPSRITEEGWKAVVDVADAVAQMPLTVHDNLHTLSDVSRQIRRDAAAGAGLIVIDYLQLIHGPAKDGRVNEVREISNALKSLALDLHLPIICLSQLSRAVETRNDKHPLLSDLRESGSVEQDADIVMMLYRDEYYNEQTETPWADLRISKHRRGETGTIRLMFDGSRMRFLPLESGDEDVDG